MSFQIFMAQWAHRHSLWYAPLKHDYKRRYLSHVMRKSALAICEQQSCRSACASAQSDQHLCCSLLRSYNTSSFYIRKDILQLCVAICLRKKTIFKGEQTHVRIWSNGPSASLVCICRLCFFTYMCFQGENCGWIHVLSATFNTESMEKMKHPCALRDLISYIAPPAPGLSYITIYW